jgi:hypothetical protein
LCQSAPGEARKKLLLLLALCLSQSLNPGNFSRAQAYPASFSLNIWECRHSLRRWLARKLAALVCLGRGTGVSASPPPWAGIPSHKLCLKPRPRTWLFLLICTLGSGCATLCRCDSALSAFGRFGLPLVFVMAGPSREPLRKLPVLENQGFRRFPFAVSLHLFNVIGVGCRATW